MAAEAIVLGNVIVLSANALNITDQYTQYFVCVWESQGIRL